MLGAPFRTSLRVQNLRAHAQKRRVCINTHSGCIVLCDNVHTLFGHGFRRQYVCIVYNVNTVKCAANKFTFLWIKATKNLCKITIFISILPILQLYHLFV